MTAHANQDDLLLAQLKLEGDATRYSGLATLK